MRINNLLAIAGLALLSIGSAEASQAFVDLALYCPSTGQFFIRSSLNGSVTAIQFGAPGDQGLLCKWDSNTINGGDNLLLFRNGVWFINLAADGATADLFVYIEVSYNRSLGTPRSVTSRRLSSCMT